MEFNFKMSDKVAIALISTAGTIITTWIVHTVF